MTIEFQPWPKTPRLNGASMIITEKIDGTNAAVVISEDGEVGAQSRNRLITPESDNAGFAKWVWENAEKLKFILGPGHHYGEWWGQGIQRRYGMDRKVFSLFNTGRWSDELWKCENEGCKVDGLDIVPVLYEGLLDTHRIAEEVELLRQFGSHVAAEGWQGQAEGVIVYIPRLGKVFKVLLENDNLPKGLVA